MKISAVAFDENAEPILAKVVSYLRDQGTLGRVIKTAIVNEAILDAYVHCPHTTHAEKMTAIAIAQAAIASKQSIIDIHLRSIGEIPPPDRVKVAVIPKAVPVVTDVVNDDDLAALDVAADLDADNYPD